MIHPFLYSFLALLPIAGLTYEHFAARQDKKECIMPGQLINMGTHHLHIHCQGKAMPSSPTVILESCIWGSTLDWKLVQPEIARFAQVCSYDRAGYGWSDRGPGPRSFDRIANELRMLLIKKGIHPPYIFVGHSWGGALVRYYHALYPDEVAGIILVDAVSEYHSHRFSPAFWAVSKAISWLAPFGLLRGLSKMISVSSSNTAWTNDIQKLYLGCHYIKPLSLNTCLEEGEAFYAGLDLLAREKKSLDNKPLIIISRGNQKLVRSGISHEENEKIHEEHLKAQKKLLLESKRSQLIIAEKSGHLINIDEPEIIVEAVRKLIQEHAI